MEGPGFRGRALALVELVGVAIEAPIQPYQHGFLIKGCREQFSVGLPEFSSPASVERLLLSLIDFDTVAFALVQ